MSIQRTQGDQPGTGCRKYPELKNQALQYLTQMVFLLNHQDDGFNGVIRSFI